MNPQWIGAAAPLAVVFVAAAAVLSSRMRPAVKQLLVAGLFMRIVGVLVMLAITVVMYGGIADAMRYFREGSAYAERMLEGDLSMWTNSSEWLAGQFWGTQFLRFSTGTIVVLLGPTLFGTTLVYALLAFFGLYGFAVAFSRTYPHVPIERYLRWLVFFPSLWLWPSAIGKEALILFGLGMLAYGYFRRERVAWFPILLGLVVVFAIRPQVAAVIIFAVVVSEWGGRAQRWTALRVAQGVVLLALGAVLVTSGLRLVTEVEGVTGAGEYLEARAAISDTRGSAIETRGVGIGAIPHALTVTLMRPFPWEARNPMALGSALEIWALWLILLVRWRSVWAALRQWRHSRFLAMGLPFVLMYAITFGMVVYNLGIVSRQRIFLFPFIFAMLEAYPPVRRAARARHPLPRPARLAHPALHPAPGNVP
jgi:hypothetical protein